MDKNFTKQELIDILSDNSKNDWLFKTADKVREENVQCKYCGLRSGNRNLERYRILKDEILLYVKKAVDMGYKTIVLQSGEDEFYSTEKICKIIKEIKKLDVAITLSIGEKSFAEYQAFKKAGADRYLLRIETTDKNLYKTMHPNMSFENRVACLFNLKTLGYEVGTGCLVGLPGQTIESLANDIMFFKDLDADMIGIGPFIPNENTPLKDEKGGDFWLALKVMALTRIMLPDINIPATTAMETLNPNGRIIALQSGANVVMPNVTSTEYRAKYEIYPNKICINENPEKCRGCIEGKIKSIGREISQGYGFHKKK